MSTPPASSPLPRRQRRRRGRRGEGSVWWDRTEGVWRASVSWKDPATGKRRRRVAVADTREEAQAALLRLRLERAEGPARAEVAAQATLGDWCRSWVAEDLPRLSVGAKTADDYRRDLALVIASPYAGTPLPDTTPEVVEALLSWRLERAPSRTSARLLRAALSRALGDAERRGLIVRNPARLARLPAEATPAKPRRSLTPDEAKALEAAIAGEPDEALWLSMLLLGLRPGEAAGLTWADVDTEGGVLHVAGARKWTPSGYVLGPPKTRRAVRALKMPPRLVQAFAKLPRGAPEALVFPNTAGGLRDPASDRQRLARLCRRAGLPVVTPYELRHTAASLLSDPDIAA